jgi:hypothetical protein
MSLKMFNGPRVHSPWYISLIGFVTVIGMLVGMLIWFSFKGSATCGKVGK